MEFLIVKHSYSSIKKRKLKENPAIPNGIITCSVVFNILKLSSGWRVTSVWSIPHDCFQVLAFDMLISVFQKYLPVYFRQFHKIIES